MQTAGKKCVLPALSTQVCPVKLIDSGAGTNGCAAQTCDVIYTGPIGCQVDIKVMRS